MPIPKSMTKQEMDRFMTCFLSHAHGGSGQDSSQPWRGLLGSRYTLDVLEGSATRAFRRAPETFLCLLSCRDC
jgi:hypothetical protein